MTRQQDMYAYAGRALDAAMAWQRGDEPATKQALDCVPRGYVALALLTLSAVLAEQIEQVTAIPAQQVLSTARAEMLKAEHEDDDAEQD